MDEMDRDFWNEAYAEDPNQVVVADYLLDYELADLRPGAALDLGCGSGQNALKLARLGWQVTGVDWAERAIELATQAARAESLDAMFIVGDITTWKPSRRFNLVICTYALPGGDKTRQTLNTARQALADGGTLIVAEWDHSMSAIWGFAEEDLLSPEQIAALLPDLKIERAEVRRIEQAFAAADDPRRHTETFANIALVRARKP